MRLYFASHAVAPENMFVEDTSAGVDQAMMPAALNAVLSSNASLIEVTRDTSQLDIAPNSLALHKPSTGFVPRHAAMAELKLSSVINVIRVQLEGGPLVHVVHASMRLNFASHAVARANMPSWW